MKKYNVMILNYDNIDTDIIIPKQFLKQTTKDGLGQYAFYDWRQDNEESQNKIVITNESRDYNVLITGANFGCGSSREHAAWALHDYGFEVIIASSFSDIFYRNWLNNHQLAIILSKETIRKIISEDVTSFELDLANKTIIINEKTYQFNLSQKMHQKLLEKIDEIDYTFKFIEEIKNYEDLNL
jgi:3-isopropylmalate dehydratase, small subunit